MRKRLESINELESLLKNKDNYIFYLDSIDECNKSLTGHYKIEDKSEKKEYCWNIIKQKIKILGSSYDDIITINNRAFSYKNISYIQKEIEIILDIKI